MACGALLAQGPRGGMGFGGPGPDIAGHAILLHGTVTGTPFSAVQVMTRQQTLANGNAIQRQETANVFRDSQGRVREEMTSSEPDGQGSRTTVVISDPVARVERVLNPRSKTVFERAMRQPMPRGADGKALTWGGVAVRQPAGDVVKEDLGSQTLNGVVATGTRFTRTIPAGAMGNAQPIQSVREVWVSNDLQTPVMIKTSDPRFGTTTTQLTNIVRSEPDAALFQTPADYTVSKGHGPRMGAPLAQ